MDRVNGDIVLQVNDPTKTAGNLIEWNVDMRVTVSNVKNSMTFQRSRTVVLFLTVIVFAVLLSNLKEEVRALQIQVQSVNVNLLLLMSKYDRLNRSLNRAWIERSERRQRSRQLYDVKGSLERALSLFKAIENFEGIRNATIGGNPPATYNSGIQYFKPVENLQNEYSWHDKDEEKDDDKFSKPLINIEGNKDGILNDTVTRFERATENRNTTEKFAEQRSGKIGYDGDENDEYFDEEDLGTWRESRGGRTRRDEGRGPLVATFVGAIPEQHVTDTVYIGPWVKSTKNNTQYSLNKFHLVEDKKSIEVTATGLYMISAQIFYFGEPTNYSYWILLSSEGKSTTRKLVKCSTASSTLATEVSCYTSVITPLQRGDRVHIQQQERDRLINMREGHSYIQLVLLSNSIGKRRLQ